MVNRTIEFYNLDMILSVGYRVKSSREANHAFNPDQVEVKALQPSAFENSC